jgi:uncharacterized glyoxalase superfamily protein PhnB
VESLQQTAKLAPPKRDVARSRRWSVDLPTSSTYAIVVLATKDLDGTFERLQATNADIVQEPTEQPYGVRDCAVRDPAGTMIRIQELP